MARPAIVLDRSLSEQEALNAMVRGMAYLRTTDIFVTDCTGSTLALSVTNASRAIPAGVRAMTFWADVAFRWRLNTAADTTNGAYATANDAVTVSFDTDDTVAPTTLQAVVASGTGTLTINFFAGT